MHRATIAILALVTIAFVGSETGSAAAFQATAVPAAVDGKLIVFGDVALFLGKPGAPVFISGENEDDPWPGLIHSVIHRGNLK